MLEISTKRFCNKPHVIASFLAFYGCVRLGVDAVALILWLIVN